MYFQYTLASSKFSAAFVLNVCKLSRNAINFVGEQLREKFQAEYWINDVSSTGRKRTSCLSQTYSPSFTEAVFHESVSLIFYDMIYDIIYLLTAIGLSSGGSTHLHTNNTQNNKNNKRTTQIQTNVEECGPCPIFVIFTLAFALQLRKKHGRTSVRVRETSVRLRKTSVRLRKTSVKVQYTYYQKHPHITKPTHTRTHAYTHYKTI